MFRNTGNRTCRMMNLWDWFYFLEMAGLNCNKNPYTDRLWRWKLCSIRPPFRKSAEEYGEFERAKDGQSKHASKNGTKTLYNLRRLTAVWFC